MVSPSVLSLSTLEPFTGHPTNNTSEHGSDDEIRTYATAMISSLRAERDLERKAHEQTRQQTDYRIIELEAQLARRDAELAACITHADDLLSQSKGQEDKFRRLNDRETRSRSRHDNRHMTKEQAIKVMEATSARNKALELEVQGLFDRVRIHVYVVYALPALNLFTSWKKLACKRHLEPYPRNRPQIPAAHTRNIIYNYPLQVCLPQNRNLIFA